MRERIAMRGFEVAVQRQPDDLAVGRLGVGEIIALDLPEGVVALGLVHADGGRLTAILSIADLDRIAGWIAEVVERGTAAIAAERATLQ